MNELTKLLEKDLLAVIKTAIPSNKNINKSLTKPKDFLDRSTKAMGATKINIKGFTP